MVVDCGRLRLEVGHGMEIGLEVGLGLVVGLVGAGARPSHAHL